MNETDNNNTALDPRISDLKLKNDTLTMKVDGKKVELPISPSIMSALSSGEITPDQLANRMLITYDKEQALKDRMTRSNEPSVSTLSAAEIAAAQAELESKSKGFQKELDTIVTQRMQVIEKPVEETVEKEYYDNGQLQSEAQMKDGVRDGLTKEYFPSGAVKGESNWSNGQLNGAFVQIVSDPNDPSLTPAANATYKIEGQFKNDQLDGTVRSYYPNGNLKEESNYKNGEKNGQSTTYYPDGTTRSVENYKNGQRHGAYEAYNESGTLVMDGFCRNGELYGEQHQYGTDGLLVRTYNYDLNGSCTVTDNEKETLSTQRTTSIEAAQTNVQAAYENIEKAQESETQGLRR